MSAKDATSAASSAETGKFAGRGREGGNQEYRQKMPLEQELAG